MPACDKLNKQIVLENNIINKIFNVSTDKQKAVYPPNQVFAKSGFDYLLTIGGDLVDDEKEYEKLKTALRSIGET